MRFDAYPQRQFVTESININSLAYHHIEGFDASLRGYQKPDFQLYQLLSIYKRYLKRLILANSLANSRGSRFEYRAPGLLEPFPTQIWMSVGGGDG